MKRAALINKISKLGLGAAFIAALCFGGSQAFANKDGELSDKTVKLISALALSQMPSQVTDTSGKVIQIDKTKPDQILIPIDDAKLVIAIGYRSGQAQNCDLPPEYQTANYQIMMREQKSKNKWTQAQMIFINRLHLMTVFWKTGQVEITKADEDSGSTDKIKSRLEANKKINEIAKKKSMSCSPEEKEKVKAAIEEYVKTVQAQLKKS